MSSGRSLHGLWCLQMTPWCIVSLKITTWEGQLRFRQGQRGCQMKRGWPERGFCNCSEGGHADDPLRQSAMGAAERRKLLHPSNSTGEGGTNGWTNYFNNNPPNICWAPSPKLYNVLLLKRSRHFLDKSLLFILRTFNVQISKICPVDSYSKTKCSGSSHSHTKDHNVKDEFTWNKTLIWGENVA